LYVAMSRIRCPTAGYRWVEGCSWRCTY
jgi:hypothetical protein